MSTGVPAVADLGPAVGTGAPSTSTGRHGRQRPLGDPPQALATAGRVAARAGGPALAVTYLSLLVLLPVAALISNAFSNGWSTFWQAVTTPEAVAALELTLVAALIVAIVNSIAGLAIAFVLVRDDFRGKAFVSAVIDLPSRCPPSWPA